ncbi:hypothetical protein [Photobacterium damselae]|uniref:hypothetical protein n=1 Tax=Photobacterium damselae TaxID=38293 RepID=UPI0030F41C70
MSFDFDELLSKGFDAANLVIQNNNEINAVFDDLEASLTKFLGIKITLIEDIEYENKTKNPLMLTSSIFEPRKRTGYNSISIYSEEADIKRRIMKIKRSNEGYPIVVVDGKNHYLSDNQREFVEAVGSVIVNPQTHLTFRAFKESYEKALK